MPELNVSMEVRRIDDTASVIDIKGDVTGGQVSDGKGRLELFHAYRKCQHLYHYMIHPLFGFMHVRLQFATAGILILAANTAYADFPRLSSIIARDGYLPRTDHLVAADHAADAAIADGNQESLVGDGGVAQHAVRRLGVVRVDVEDRDLVDLRDVGRIEGRAAGRGRRREPVRVGLLVAERCARSWGSAPIIAEVRGLTAAGATIVLQSLQRWWAPLTAFSRQLELFLTHPVQVNAYVTQLIASLRG